MRRRPDLLDETADIRERVRKLEVLPHSRTLVPKLWEPDRSDADILTDLLALMAGVDDYTPGGYTLPPSTGPAGQWLYQYMLSTQGVLGWAPGERDQWTMFLWRLGLLAAPHTWGATGAAAGDPSDYSGWAGAPAFRQIVAPANGGGNGSGRYFEFGGFPGIGSWYWANKDALIGGATMPNLGSIPQIGADAETGPWVMPPGGFFMDHNGNEPYIGRDNVYPVGDHVEDCGEPGTIPIYNPAVHPGIALAYDAPPFPCPKSPTGLGVGGHIFRVQTVLPALDWGLLGPPWPKLLAGPGSTADNAFPSAPDWAGRPFYVDNAPDEMALYPAVAGWFAHHLPIAEAKVRERHHLNWQSLRVFVGWLGRVEAQHRQRTINLRGRVFTWFTPSLQQSPVFVAPSNIPMVEPGRRPRFLAQGELRSTAGTEQILVPVHAQTVSDPDDNDVHFTVDELWVIQYSDDRDARGLPLEGELHLNFDGITFGTNA